MTWINFPQRQSVTAFLHDGMQSATMALTWIDEYPLCVEEKKHSWYSSSNGKYQYDHSPLQGTTYERTGQYTGIGSFTIVEKSAEQGTSMRSRLKSGAGGWILKKRFSLI